MTSQHHRLRHIETARELARELRLAWGQFDERALRDLDRSDLWPAIQPCTALVAKFRAFLERLRYDGIRSRSCANFDASKLILPLACEVADRLDMLAEELEMQAGARAHSGPGHRRASAELRIEN